MPGCGRKLPLIGRFVSPDRRTWTDPLVKLSRIGQNLNTPSTPTQGGV
jgi:hypothetical protein